MNPIRLRRKVLHLGFQLQYLQDVADLLRDAVHGTAFQFLVDFSPEGKVICYPAIRREESPVCEDDSVLPQKFLTEQGLVDVLPIKPDGKICVRRFPVRFHIYLPPFDFLSERFPNR